MKIVFVEAQLTDRSISGGLVYNQNLQRELVKLGCDVEVVSIDPVDATPELAYQILAMTPDLILQDELCFQALRKVNHYVKKQFDIPIVALVHVLSAQLTEANEKRTEVLSMELAYLENCDGAIFVSENAKREANRLLGIVLNSKVCSPGARYWAGPKFNKGRKIDEIHLLTVSNCEPNKGFIDLLQVLRDSEVLLGDLKIQLDVVGPIPQSHLLYLEAERLEKSSSNLKVVFHDILSFEELSMLYAISHYLIVSSHYESFCQVAAEALGQGLPVINFAEGGICQFIHDQKNGFQLNRKDLSRFRDIVAMPLLDYQGYLNLRARSKESFDLLPNWKDSANIAFRYLKEFVHA